MVSARKFAELGAPVADEIGELSPVETTTRNLTLDFTDVEDPESLAVGQSHESVSVNSNHHSTAAETAINASAAARGK
jgi:hypothetical protein